MELTPAGVLLHLADGERDPEQRWFWTEEWQEGEREVDEAIRRGERGTIYTDAEFDEHLRAVDAELRAQAHEARMRAHDIFRNL